jgi:hypothetical protein
MSVTLRTSSKRSLDNHHADACKPDGVASPATHKRNLSYSDDEYEESVHAQSKDESFFATFAVPGSKKGMKKRKSSK